MLKGQFLKMSSSEDLLIQEVVITVFSLLGIAVRVPEARRRDILTPVSCPTCDTVS